MKNIFIKVVLIGFVFLYSFRIASASIVINEIMYDLDGGDIDWIEVYNPDSADVNLTTLKLADTDPSNHSIKASSGSAVLHTGDYGIIVRSSVLSNYTAKWGTTGNIFTSSFSLPNDTGKVEINNGDKNSPISTLTYQSSQGASENGKSLQNISGTWQESAPTPGKENTLSVVNTNNEQTQSSQNSESSQNENNSETNTTIKIPQQGLIVEALLKNNVVFAGLRTKFQGKVSRDGRALFYGRYFWNFGDGGSEEMKVNTGGEVSHTYFYPGEYKLTLEYYANDYGDRPEASDSIIVKVIKADILISSVGNESDFFIELSNNTDKDVDIGKWMLTSGDKRFVFPKNTIISAKKKITFSPFVTGLVFSDKNNLKLIDQDWKTIFDYALSVTPPPPPVVVHNSKSKVTVARSTSVNNSAIAESLTTEFLNQAETSDEIPETLSASLGAQALSSESGIDNKKSLYYVILVVLLVVGGSAIYFIRRSNRQILKTGEDFEILEE